jgi:hypothetical protein
MVNINSRQLPVRQARCSPVRTDSVQPGLFFALQQSAHTLQSIEAGGLSLRTPLTN